MAEMSIDDVYEWARRSPYHLSTAAETCLVLGCATSPGPVVARGSDVKRFPTMVEQARRVALRVTADLVINREE